MLAIIKRELLIYVIVLIALAALMHQAELPERISLALEDPSIFLHAIQWSVLGYVLLLVFRLIFRGISRLFMKKSDQS